MGGGGVYQSSSLQWQTLGNDECRSSCIEWEEEEVMEEEEMTIRRARTMLYNVHRQEADTADTGVMSA